MKSQVLFTVWCNISGEAAGEILSWSLLEMKGLRVKHVPVSSSHLLLVQSRRTFWNLSDFYVRRRESVTVSFNYPHTGSKNRGFRWSVSTPQPRRSGGVVESRGRPGCSRPTAGHTRNAPELSAAAPTGSSPWRRRFQFDIVFHRPRQGHWPIEPRDLPEVPSSEVGRPGCPCRACHETSPVWCTQNPAEDHLTSRLIRVPRFWRAWAPGCDVRQGNPRHGCCGGTSGEHQGDQGADAAAASWPCPAVVSRVDCGTVSPFLSNSSEAEGRAGSLARSPRDPNHMALSDFPPKLPATPWSTTATLYEHYMRERAVAMPTPGPGLSPVTTWGVFSHLWDHTCTHASATPMSRPSRAPSPYLWTLLWLWTVQPWESFVVAGVACYVHDGLIVFNNDAKLILAQRI